MQAYALSRKADLEVQQRHYDKAASFYSQASDKYTEAIKLTKSPEVSWLEMALRRLADMYRLSKRLRSWNHKAGTMPGF